MHDAPVADFAPVGVVLIRAGPDEADLLPDVGINVQLDLVAAVDGNPSFGEWDYHAQPDLVRSAFGDLKRVGGLGGRRVVAHSVMDQPVPVGDTRNARRQQVPVGIVEPIVIEKVVRGGVLAFNPDGLLTRHQGKLDGGLGDRLYLDDRRLLRRAGEDQPAKEHRTKETCMHGGNIAGSASEDQALSGSQRWPPVSSDRGRVSLVKKPKSANSDLHSL